MKCTFLASRSSFAIIKVALALLGRANGSRELRSIGTLPAFDFAKVRDQLAVVAGNMPHDRLALGI